MSDVEKIETNISIKEYFEILIWTFKINFKLMKWSTTFRIISLVFDEFKPIIAALVSGWLIDKIFGVKPENLVNTIITILIFYGGFQLISIIMAEVSNLASMSSSKWSFWGMREILSHKIHELTLYQSEQPEFANIVLRANDALNNLPEQTQRIISLISTIIKIIFLSYYLFPIVPMQLLLLSLLIIPRYFFVGKLVRDIFSFYIVQTENRKVAMSNILAITDIKELPEIRISRAYKFFARKYNTYYNWLIKKDLGMQVKRAGISSLMNFFGMAIVFWAISDLLFKIGNGEVSVGQFTAISANLTNYMYAVFGIVGMFSSTYELTVKMKDIKTILDMKPDNISGEKDKAIKKENVIKIQNVNFAYPNSEKIVLKNVNLTIQPKDKIAIVGANGAGKTTLIKLLLKLYRVSYGQILIDNLNLDQISDNRWYKQVSVLMQDFNLYPQLSAYENVIAGDPNKKESRNTVINALKNADAWNFVSKYPFKEQQILGEKYKNGIRPSSGQWQKIAIARFLYSDCNIVIFDEPTASIDSVSEAKIFENIFETLKDKTVIIISHRFSTVRRADKIVVMDDGKIAELGTHKELLAIKDGVYAKSFNLQAEGYK
jgi:ABC-type multidrug transport system fused ATPase/permease subunit